MGRQTRERDRQTDASQFTELLECERELGEQLSRAQAQARQRVDEARASSSRAEANLEALLEEESDRLRTRIREEAQIRVREILAQSHERAAGFDRISNEQVERLATAAFRRLIAPGGPS
jgi:vacuolar-type H+-ATPase subunit H